MSFRNLTSIPSLVIIPNVFSSFRACHSKQRKEETMDDDDESLLSCYSSCQSLSSGQSGHSKSSSLSSSSNRWNSCVAAKEVAPTRSIAAPKVPKRLQSIIQDDDEDEHDRGHQEPARDNESMVACAGECCPKMLRRESTDARPSLPRRSWSSSPSRTILLQGEQENVEAQEVRPEDVASSSSSLSTFGTPKF